MNLSVLAYDMSKFFEISGIDKFCGDSQKFWRIGNQTRDISTMRRPICSLISPVTTEEVEVHYIQILFWKEWFLDRDLFICRRLISQIYTIKICKNIGCSSWFLSSPCKLIWLCSNSHGFCWKVYSSIHTELDFDSCESISPIICDRDRSCDLRRDRRQASIYRQIYFGSNTWRYKNFNFDRIEARDLNIQIIFPGFETRHQTKIQNSLFNQERAICNKSTLHASPRDH